MSRGSMRGTLIRRAPVALGALLALSAGACGGGGGGPLGGLVEAAKTSTPPQASLSLLGSDVALCNHNDTAWTLAKTGPASATDGDTVNWTVTVTRGATTADFLDVNGYM